jgi:hypothetical protein
MRAKRRQYKPMPNSAATEELAELQGMLETKWALDQGYFQKKLAAVESDVSAGAVRSVVGIEGDVVSGC